MSTAAERGEGAAASLKATESPSSAVSKAVVLLSGSVAVLIASAVLAGGGSSDRTLPWIGAGALLVSAIGIAAAAFGLLPFPRPSGTGAASVALLSLFVVWTGVTLYWSIAPERSWSSFNRGVVCLALLVSGLLVGAALRRAPVLAARFLVALVAATLCIALASKVLPGLHADGGRMARLRAPLGFWNALALLFAITFPAVLWLTSELRSRLLRAGGAVLAYALVVGILLTFSRSGLVTAVAGVAAWVALSSRRWDSVLVLVVAVPAGIAVSLWAFGQPGVAADAQDLATRREDGFQFAVVFLLGATVVLLAGLAAFRLDLTHLQRRWTLPRRAATGFVIIALALLGTGVLLKADQLGGWTEAQAREFANPPEDLVTQDPSRLTSINSNNRWGWWLEAWTAFRSEPLGGSGAGSFELTHRYLRDDPLTVTEPHSMPLQFLSETGLIGALLAGGAVTCALVAIVGRVRRLSGADHAAATALAIGVGVYVMHALVDWDWEFLSVTAPVFAIVGLLLAYDGSAAAPGRRRPFGALVSLVVLCVGVWSLMTPWLAEQRLGVAYDRLAEGQPGAAVDAADEARALNPIAVDPLIVRSLAQTILGDVAGARDSLRRATELQPRNPDTWFELGAFELEVAKRPGAAIPALERAYALDRFGPAGPLLVEARGNSP